MKMNLINCKVGLIILVFYNVAFFHFFVSRFLGCDFLLIDFINNDFRLVVLRYFLRLFSPFINF